MTNESEIDFQKNGWRAKINQRPQASSKSDLIRIDAEMLNINPDLIFQFFINPPKDTIGIVTESRVLEENKNGDRFIYWRFKIPFCSERDNISLVHQEERDGG